MIKRSTDPEAVANAIRYYIEPNFSVEDWCSQEENVALTDGKGNFCLFEYDEAGRYYGHYFHKVRGKEARDLTKEIISYFFLNYPAEAIQGLTPIELRAARWMARQVGLKSFGIINTENGPAELFILTRLQWRQDNG